ncbi:MAG: hypothetical protein ABI831_27980 [Betaproteobacteria bacterium]
MSIGIRFGTLGVGAEVAKLVTPHVGIRVGAGFLSATRNFDESDVTFDAHLKMHAISGLIDLFPGRRGSFHVTGGIMTNPLEITGTGVPKANGTITINGHDYTTAQVGVLTGTGKWSSTLPYVGFGFGTPAASHAALRFVFDVGAAIGKAKVGLTATGAATNAQLQSDLNAQVVTTQDDVNKVPVYPVINLGLVVRF